MCIRDRTDSLAKGYMAGTGDPYAKYLTVEEYSRQNQSGLSKSVGIGVVTSLDETGYIRVEEVYPESPALAADIQPGDLIVRIDETDVTKDNCEELQMCIRDRPHTPPKGRLTLWNPKFFSS